MRHLTCLLLVLVVVGCSVAPARAPSGEAPYQRVHLGMSRSEVYELLGTPGGSVGQGFRESATESWSDIPVKGDSIILTFGADGRAFIIEHKRGG